MSSFRESNRCLVMMANLFFTLQKLSWKIVFDATIISTVGMFPKCSIFERGDASSIRAPSTCAGQADGDYF